MYRVPVPGCIQMSPPPATSVDATVVAVDDKAGKVTVRLQGDSKDTMVSLDKVTTQ